MSDPYDLSAELPQLTHRINSFYPATHHRCYLQSMGELMVMRGMERVAAITGPDHLAQGFRLLRQNLQIETQRLAKQVGVTREEHYLNYVGMDRALDSYFAAREEDGSLRSMQ